MPSLTLVRTVLYERRSDIDRTRIYQKRHDIEKANKKRRREIKAEAQADKQHIRKITQKAKNKLLHTHAKVEADGQHSSR